MPLNSSLPFNIDNILGGSKSRDQKSKGGFYSSKCCPCQGCDRSRQYDKCRCKCHDKQQMQFSSSFGQKERKRTTFTDHQNKSMMSLFSKQQYLDGSNRKKIAKDLGLDEAQVKRKWQNMRAKTSKSMPLMGGIKSSSVTNTDPQNMFRNLRFVQQSNHMPYNASYPKADSYKPKYYHNNLALFPSNKGGFQTPGSAGTSLPHKHSEYSSMFGFLPHMIR